MLQTCNAFWPPNILCYKLVTIFDPQFFMLQPCNTFSMRVKHVLLPCNTFYFPDFFCYKVSLHTNFVLLQFQLVTQLFVCYKDVLPKLCPVVVKALYGRQPGCFYFRFSLCPLAVTIDLFLVLFLEFFIKCQVSPILDWKSCLLYSEILFQHKSVYGMIFHSYSVALNELIYEL